MPFSSSKTRNQSLRLSDSNDSINFASNSSNSSKQVSNSTNTQNYSLESQVVSANKFDQNLREIDGSVVVSSGKELQDLQISSTKDLGKIFPGLIFKTQDVAHPDVSVRGINTTNSYEPSMVFYVDGVPQDPTFLAQELLDVQRVELLRGPQGTIWGQNAQAGILNIVTNPINSNTPSLKASTSIGSLYKQAIFSASTPLVQDWLYIGGNLSYKRFSGQTKNVISLGTAERTKKDASDWLSGVANIAFAPKDSGFLAHFKYSIASSDNHQSGFLLDHQQYKTLEIDSKFYVPDNQYEISTYALKLNYDFKQSQLSNAASYQDRFYTNTTERYSRGFSVAKNLSYYRELRKTFTDELRFTTQYNNGAYSIFGLYYQNTDFRMSQPQTSTYNAYSKDVFAVFGEGKMPLLWGFDLTLGLRYSQDHAKSPDKKTYDKGTPTPKVALGYDLNDSVRFYALYQAGYKAGGFDLWTQQRVNPENSHNFEIGTHSGFWDDKVSLDISAYYIYTQDKQMYVLEGPRNVVLRNAGTADSKGVELSFVILPTDSFRFSFGGTFGIARYIKGSTSGLDIKGNVPSFSPDITMNANLDWRFWDTNKAKFFLGLNGNFYSKMYFQETNDTFEDPYGLLDGSIRIELKDSLSLSFYVQNIFNQKYKIIDNSPRTYAYVIGDLRDIGLSLKYKF